MSAKLTVHQRLKLIKRALSGENVTKLCKEAKVSRTVFYRWIKKFKKEHGDLSQAINSIEKSTLRPQDRLEMIERVKLGEEVASVCRLYKVSRTVFYRWLKRYEEAPEGKKLEALWDQKPKIEKYYRQASDEYEQAVLAGVREYPELSSHKLVWVLPQIGGRPILGNHGVQNVLRRHNLSTFEQRLSFSQAFHKPTFATRFFGVFQTLLSFIGSKQAPQRKAIVIGSFTIGFTIFGGVVIYGLISLVGLITSAPSIAFSIGIIFALTALTFGMLFFIYSLKYYITIASILSFSRTLSSEEKEGRSQLHFHDTYSGRVGLKADLTNINLDTKPFVSIHLASYNEKKVIDRLLTAATSMEYENYEVVLVDDSTDPEAIEIVNKWKENPRVKIIQRSSRAGYKGGALGVALEHTDPKAEFIMVFDSDFIPYPDSITQFLKYFKASVGTLNKNEYTKSNVAAVQGYQWHVLNKSENWITRGVRTEYAGSYVIERSGTELYSGLKQISGSVYIIRKDVLARVGWGTSITEDFELTLRLYAQGFKVVYTPYIQAPAEAVSTIKRLIRQRMRWAEGHSFNIKKYFGRLIFSKNLTYAEKGELLYLSPYYLQAFFFIVGTLSWFLAEVVFQVTLPFWTSTWGWSLVFTNLFALPLMNMVGLFLEESSEKDYLGIFSFVAMTYIIAPFMGYASVKGFLEKEEGPWFRTPKTGKITDVFTPSRFYKFIFGVFGRNVPIAGAAAARFANLIRKTGGYQIGDEHIQRLGDEYEEWDEEGTGYRGQGTGVRVQGSGLFFAKAYLKWAILWVKDKFGIIKESEKIFLDEPRLAIQSAYNTFSNLRPPKRSQNTLIGKIILTGLLALTVLINQMTFMTQYEIDLANFSIKAKTSVPLLAQGGFPQGGPAVAPDPAVEQQINIINQEFSTASTSDVPTDNSLGIVRWTAGSYDPSPTVYFEAILRNDTAGAVTTATLYDAPAGGTGAVAVYNSPVSVTSQTYTRVRSGAITLTTGTDYTVRVKASSGTAYIIAARIVAQQSTVTYVANTETQIELGANETTTSTSTSNILTNPKIWLYTSGNYDGTVTAYFEATIKSSDTATSQASLYDKTAGALVASSTVTSDATTNWQRIRSGAITLTSGNEYEVAFNKVTSGTASIANAKVIITQTSAGGLEASELYHDYITYSNTQIVGTLSTFSTTSQAQLLGMVHVHQSETATIGSSSYIYLIGGQNTVGAQVDRSTVYKSTLNGITGDTGTFATTSQAQLPLLSTELSSTKATIGPSTYIYVLGGSDAGVETTTAYKTTVNSTTGDLSAFATTSQSQLPEVRALASAVTASIGPSSYIYSIGGCSSTCSNNNSRSSVYKATINGSGDISTAFATTSQAQVPLKTQKSAVVKADIGGSSYIYVLGGVMNTTVASTVYKGTINATSGDLASLTTTSQIQLPDKIQRLSASLASIGPSTYLYVTGGERSTVYRATVNTSSGDVGSFSTTNQAQIPIAQSDFSQNFLTINGSSYLYMMGGVDTTAGKINQSTVYKAPLSDDYNRFRFDNLYDPSKWVGGTFTYYHEGTEKPMNGIDTAYGRITPGSLASFQSQNTNNIGAFATTSQGQIPTPAQLLSSETATVGSSTYLYVIGGVNSAVLSTVYRSTINNSTKDAGAFATTSQGQLPLRREAHSTALASIIGPSTYVYVLGGGVSATAGTSTVYKSTIDSTTGNLSAFATTSQSQLLEERVNTGAATATIGPSTYIYLVGGCNITDCTIDNTRSSVYKATINSSGNISTAFATTSQGQLAFKSEISAKGVVKADVGGSSYIYILGGDSAGTRLSTVYKSTINSGTGDLNTVSTTSQAQLPQLIELLSASAQTVGPSTYLYAIGGTTGTVLSTVYRSTINNTTGNAGAFSTTSQAQLPALYSSASQNFTALNGSNYLYLLGGTTGTVQSTVYKAQLTSPGYERVRSSSFDPFLPNNTNIQAFSTTGQAQFTQLKQQTPAIIHTIGSSSYLYVLGGLFHSTVYKGILNSNTYDLEALNTTNQGQLAQKYGASGTVKGTIGSSTYIYIIGGQTDSTPTLISTVYKATINSLSGDIGTFDSTSQAQFPLKFRYIWNQTKVLTVGSSTYIYVLGGQDGSVSYSTVYRSTLNGTTGDAGTFDTVSQAQLPGTFSLNTSEIATIGSSSYIYFMGGSGRSTLYKSTINSTTGNTGAFNTTSQAQLPEKLGQLSSQILSNGNSTYLFVLGGTTGTLQSTVYKSTLDGLTGNVGVFSTVSQSQLAASDVNFTNPSITVGNSTYLYVIGGTSGGQSAVYKTALPTFRNQAGEVGTFSTTSQAQYPGGLFGNMMNVSATMNGSTYIYILGGYDGTANKSSVYRSNLSNITGDAGTFTSTAQNQLPLLRAATDAIQTTLGTSTYIYVIGGAPNGSTAYKSVIDSQAGNMQIFSTTSQAQLSAFTRDPAITNATIGSSTYVYVLGGCTDSSCAAGNILSTVYKSTIKDDSGTGNTGAFDTTSQAQSPTTISEAMSFTQTVGLSTYLYVLGGFDGTNRISTVYKATMDSAGNIGAFATTSQGQLGRKISQFTATKYNIGPSTYIYVLGGTTGTRQSTIYKAAINLTNGDIGTFDTTSQPQLPGILGNLGSVTATIGASTYLYIIGGEDPTVYSNVYKATLDSSNGDIGSLATTSQAQLPVARQSFGAISLTVGSSTYLYVIGGADSASRSSVYKATVNGITGDVGTFNTTSQAQVQTILTQIYPSATTIGSSTYIYTVGGNRGTASSNVYKATVNSSTGDISSFDTTSQVQLPVISRRGPNTSIATVGSSTYLYTIGIYDGTTTFSTVYRSTLNGSMVEGDLDTFSTTSQSQLSGVFRAPSALTQTVGSSTYLYLIGGDRNTSRTSTLYKATLNSTTGDMGALDTSSQGQLPNNLKNLGASFSTVGSSTYLYVIGGIDPSVRVSTVYVATLNSTTGDIGFFSTTNQAQIPQNIEDPTTPVQQVGSSTYIYVIGGFDGTTRLSTVYKSALVADGNNLDTEIQNAQVSASWLVINITALQIPENLLALLPLGLVLPHLVRKYKEWRRRRFMKHES